MSRMTANTMDTSLDVNDLRAYQQMEDIIIAELFRHGPLNKTQCRTVARQLLRRFAKDGISLYVPAQIVEAAAVND
jgi:hypothetical protein